LKFRSNSKEASESVSNSGEKLL